MDQRYKLDFNVPPVLDFFKQHCPGFMATQDLTAIGLRRDGQLVAATLYENFNGANVWVHCAGESGARWLVRDYLLAIFAFPFEVCKVQRVSAYVQADNWRSRRFIEHLGFQAEAVLRGAGSAGVDLIVYVMWKKDCRYVSLAQNGI